MSSVSGYSAGSSVSPDFHYTEHRTMSQSAVKVYSVLVSRASSMGSPSLAIVEFLCTLTLGVSTPVVRLGTLGAVVTAVIGGTVLVNLPGTLGSEYVLILV